MTYIVQISKTAKKEIRKLDKSTFKKVDKAIFEMIDSPFRTNTEKLTNHPEADYRRRIGNYRVLFDVLPGKIVRIIHIWHRGRDYKK